MIRALYTAASGMAAQQMNLDAIANNLANSSTTGFQQRQVNFTDLLYQNAIMPGSAATQQTTVAAGLQIGLGTRPGATEVIQTQGNFITTGNPLDLAIQGAGFFQILLLTLLPVILCAARGVLRLAAVIELLPEWREKLLAYGWAWTLLAPLVPLVYLYNTFVAALTRTITWRGIRYELVSPHQTRILPH